MLDFYPQYSFRKVQWRTIFQNCVSIKSYFTLFSFLMPFSMYLYSYSNAIFTNLSLAQKLFTPAYLDVHDYFSFVLGLLCLELFFCGTKSQWMKLNEPHCSTTCTSILWNSNPVEGKNVWKKTTCIGQINHIVFSFSY